MRLLLTALIFMLASPSAAQDVSGRGRAADGDSLDLSGIAVRLHGIDAPELAQSCVREGITWPCGKEAAGKLSSLISGRDIQCEQKDIDGYRRIVATCRVGGVEVGAAMVEAGLAVALPHFSEDYVGAEARARTARRGLWAGTFVLPADYRAAHPRPRPPASDLPRRSAAVRAPAVPGIYYRNCNEARASGAAPLHRGQPGYRPEMDGDGDGIACEPYRGR